MMKIDQNNGQIRVIGLVSAGIGCALPKLPGLYTKVSAFIPWIKQFLSAVTPGVEKIPYDPVISINKTLTNPNFNITEIFINQTNINNNFVTNSSSSTTTSKSTVS